VQVGAAQRGQAVNIFFFTIENALVSRLVSMSSLGPPKKVDSKLAAARKEIEEKRKGSGRLRGASVWRGPLLGRAALPRRYC
jgi:hypothetical protein